MILQVKHPIEPIKYDNYAILYSPGYPRSYPSLPVASERRNKEHFTGAFYVSGLWTWKSLFKTWKMWAKERPIEPT
jgi:hypothetical protein